MNIVRRLRAGIPGCSQQSRKSFWPRSPRFVLVSNIVDVPEGGRVGVVGVDLQDDIRHGEGGYLVGARGHKVQEALALTARLCLPAGRIRPYTTSAALVGPRSYGHTATIAGRERPGAATSSVVSGSNSPSLPKSRRRYHPRW